jgi:hypothetical protein
MLFIFRFSKFIKVVIKTRDSEELKKAFKNLRSYFTYIGILVIAALVIYVIAFLIMGSSVTFLK